LADNSPEFSELTGLPNVSWLVKPHFCWYMKQKWSSRSISACWHSEWKEWSKTKVTPHSAWCWITQSKGDNRPNLHTAYQ